MSTLPAAPAERTTEAHTGMAAPSGEEFGGLTSRDCSWDCTPDHCVISGRNFCAHPAKGGMQGVMQTDPIAMRRYNKARRVVAMEIAARKADRGEL